MAAGQHPSRTPDRLAPFSGEAALDTTAQLLHDPKPSVEQTLVKRAKAKLYNEAVLAGLTSLGRDYTPLAHSYGRTLECAAGLKREAGKLTSRYCGNRWCQICSRIRTAKLRGAYAPMLAGWRDVHFLTVTIPNVSGRELHGTIRHMIATSRKIAHAIRRTERLPWKALRKFEVTWNRERLDYHPHLHFVVDGEASARVFLKRWLEAYPRATRIAQDIRPADPDRAMAELFKYLSKQIDTGLERDKKTKRVQVYPAGVLDRIYRAVRRLRTIQPMGFKVAKEIEELTDDDTTLELEAQNDGARDLAYFEWQGGDWMDSDTGELLTGYEPSRSLRAMLEQIRASSMGLDPPPDG